MGTPQDPRAIVAKVLVASGAASPKIADEAAAVIVAFLSDAGWRFQHIDRPGELVRYAAAGASEPAVVETAPPPAPVEPL